MRCYIRTWESMPRSPHTKVPPPAPLVPNQPLASGPHGRRQLVQLPVAFKRRLRFVEHLSPTFLAYRIPCGIFVRVLVILDECRAVEAPLARIGTAVIPSHDLQPPLMTPFMENIGDAHARNPAKVTAITPTMKEMRRASVKITGLFLRVPTVPSPMKQQVTAPIQCSSRNSLLTHATNLHLRDIDPMRHRLRRDIQ